MKIEPVNQSKTRALGIKLMGDMETCYYTPCPGFDLDQTSCAEWLSWHLLTTNSSQLVQVLKVKSGINLNDPRLDRTIRGLFRNHHIPRIDSLVRRPAQGKRKFSSYNERQCEKSPANTDITATAPSIQQQQFQLYPFPPPLPIYMSTQSTPFTNNILPIMTTPPPK